jgi:hypothetical protein
MADVVCVCTLFSFVYTSVRLFNMQPYRRESAPNREHDRAPYGNAYYESQGRQSHTVGETGCKPLIVRIYCYFSLGRGGLESVFK